MSAPLEGLSMREPLSEQELADLRREAESLSYTDVPSDLILRLLDDRDRLQARVEGLERMFDGITLRLYETDPRATEEGL